MSAAMEEYARRQAAAQRAATGYDSDAMDIHDNDSPGAHEAHLNVQQSGSVTQKEHDHSQASQRPQQLNRPYCAENVKASGEICRAIAKTLWQSQGDEAAVKEQLYRLPRQPNGSVYPRLHKLLKHRLIFIDVKGLSVSFHSKQNNCITIDRLPLLPDRENPMFKEPVNFQKKDGRSIGVAAGMVNDMLNATSEDRVREILLRIPRNKRGKHIVSWVRRQFEDRDMIIHPDGKSITFNNPPSGVPSFVSSIKESPASETKFDHGNAVSITDGDPDPAFPSRSLATEKPEDFGNQGSADKVNSHDENGHNMNPSGIDLRNYNTDQKKELSERLADELLNATSEDHVREILARIPRTPNGAFSGRKQAWFSVYRKKGIFFNPDGPEIIFHTPAPGVPKRIIDGVRKHEVSKTQQNNGPGNDQYETIDPDALATSMMSAPSIEKAQQQLRSLPRSADDGFVVWWVRDTFKYHGMTIDQTGSLLTFEDTPPGLLRQVSVSEDYTTIDVVALASNILSARSIEQVQQHTRGIPRELGRRTVASWVRSGLSQMGIFLSAKGGRLRFQNTPPGLPEIIEIPKQHPEVDVDALANEMLNANSIDQVRQHLEELPRQANDMTVLPWVRYPLELKGVSVTPDGSEVEFRAPPPGLPCRISLYEVPGKKHKIDEDPYASDYDPEQLGMDLDRYENSALPVLEQPDVDMDNVQSMTLPIRSTSPKECVDSYKDPLSEILSGFPDDAADDAKVKEALRWLPRNPDTGQVWWILREMLKSRRVFISVYGKLARFEDVFTGRFTEVQIDNMPSRAEMEKRALEANTILGVPTCTRCYDAVGVCKCEEAKIINNGEGSQSCQSDKRHSPGPVPPAGAVLNQKHASEPISSDGADLNQKSSSGLVSFTGYVSHREHPSGPTSFAGIGQMDFPNPPRAQEVKQYLRNLPRDRRTSHVSEDTIQHLSHRGIMISKDGSWARYQGREGRAIQVDLKPPRPMEQIGFLPSRLAVSQDLERANGHSGSVPKMTREQGATTFNSRLLERKQIPTAGELTATGRPMRAVRAKAETEAEDERIAKELERQGKIKYNLRGEEFKRNQKEYKTQKQKRKAEQLSATVVQPGQMLKGQDPPSPKRAKRIPAYLNEGLGKFSL